jgi:UDP-glucose 4-epimerase
LNAIEAGKIYENVGKKGKYRAFNLGTGTAYSVKQMIEAMKKASGFDYKYDIVGRR